jgi:hypothetical protein
MTKTKIVNEPISRNTVSKPPVSTSPAATTPVTAKATVGDPPRFTRVAPWRNSRSRPRP